MVHAESKLRAIARKRGTFRFYLGGGEALSRVDGSTVDGPAVVRVSRTRTDVAVVRYRDIVAGVSYARW